MSPKFASTFCAKTASTGPVRGSPTETYRFAGFADYSLEKIVESRIGKPRDDFGEERVLQPAKQVSPSRKAFSRLKTATAKFHLHASRRVKCSLASTLYQRGV